MYGADGNRHTALGQSRLYLGQSYASLLGEQLPDETPVRLGPARVPAITARLGARPSMLKGNAPPMGSPPIQNVGKTSKSLALEAIG